MRVGGGGVILERGTISSGYFSRKVYWQLFSIIQLALVLSPCFGLLDCARMTGVHPSQPEFKSNLALIVS